MTAPASPLQIITAPPTRISLQGITSGIASLATSILCDLFCPAAPHLTSTPSCGPLRHDHDNCLGAASDTPTLTPTPSPSTLSPSTLPPTTTSRTDGPVPLFSTAKQGVSGSSLATSTASTNSSPGGSSSRQTVVSLSTLTTTSTLASPTTITIQRISSSPSPPSGSTKPDPHVASSSASHTSAIVGGLVGGLAAIAIVVAALVLIRRRARKSRFPPSAEFVREAFGGLPVFTTPHREGSMTPSGDRLIPHARQSSLEEIERPPLFTPGGYLDPVFEKVQAATET